MSQKKEQTPDVFGVDNEDRADDEEVTSIEIVQIVPAPPGWIAMITQPGKQGYGVLPIACFALIQLSFVDNTVAQRIVAQVVSLHGRFVDADSLDNFAGVIGPGTDPTTVLAAISEDGGNNTGSEG
jgi:hypothetical protein